MGREKGGTDAICSRKPPLPTHCDCENYLWNPISCLLKCMLSVAGGEALHLVLTLSSGSLRSVAIKFNVVVALA